MSAARGDRSGTSRVMASTEGTSAESDGDADGAAAGARGAAEAVGSAAGVTAMGASVVGGGGSDGRTNGGGATFASSMDAMPKGGTWPRYTTPAAPASTH